MKKFVFYNKILYLCIKIIKFYIWIIICKTKQLSKVLE